MNVYFLKCFISTYQSNQIVYNSKLCFQISFFSVWHFSLPLPRMVRRIDPQVKLYELLSISKLLCRDDIRWVLVYYFTDLI